jgi:hypothetical protein
MEMNERDQNQKLQEYRVVAGYIGQLDETSAVRLIESLPDIIKQIDGQNRPLAIVAFADAIARHPSHFVRDSFAKSLVEGLAKTDPAFKNSEPAMELVHSYREPVPESQVIEPWRHPVPAI